MPQCGPGQIPRGGKKRLRTFSKFSPGEELFGRYGGMRICQVLVQNSFQVGASSPFEMKFVLLQKAQTGPDDLGFVVKSAGGDDALNHLLKVRSYDFAHAGLLQQFATVVNNLGWLAGKSPPIPSRTGKRIEWLGHSTLHLSLFSLIRGGPPISGD